MSKYVLFVVIAAVCFAFGRYSAPEKVKIQKEIVEVDKKEKDTHRKTKKVVRTKPDGTKEEIITDETDTSEKESSRSKEKDKSETVRSSDSVNISGLVAIHNFQWDSGPVYGLAVTKPLLGPITIGAFGFTDKTIGVSLGLNF